MKLSDISYSSLKKVSTKELVNLHRRLHQLYSLQKKRNKDITQLVKIHNIITKEIKDRKLKHYSNLYMSEVKNMKVYEEKLDKLVDIYMDEILLECECSKMKEVKDPDLVGEDLELEDFNLDEDLEEIGEGGLYDSIKYAAQKIFDPKTRAAAKAFKNRQLLKGAQRVGSQINSMGGLRPAYAAA